jgi:hypothetical protein
MRKKLTATICCLVLSCALYAQNGWLPPVSYPSALFCDPAPWKLVLSDDFNGTQLNRDIWDSYLRGGSNNDENWEGARNGGNGGNNWNYVDLDENVVVSNGTCKLITKHEPVNWNCASCPVNTPRYYTCGTLTTPYFRASQPNYFNAGRFEVRMKMPFFNRAHTTVWTWYGRSVNEIDFVEAYGSGRPNIMANNYNLHAWGPDPANNPFHLPDNATLSGSYPGQSWWQMLTRSSTYNYTAWHTYTGEWDTASIKLILDNTLINTIWKYYYTVRIGFGPRGSRNPVRYYDLNIGSGCIGTRSGEYKITYGYPYNSNSQSNFRITPYIDGTYSQQGDYTNTSTTLGQAEIDYVRIWQKHPELDGHTELCAASTYPATPVISGPNEVCGQVAYTVSPAVTGGTWSSFNNDILYISNPTTSGVDVAKDAGPAFNQGWVAYSYGNGIPECPLQSVYKRNLYCNQSTNWEVMVPTVLNNNGEGRFHFISNLYHKRDVSGGTTPVVTWNISINNGIDYYDENTAENFTLYGQYASSPSFQAQENQSYNLRWTMNVTDASGTHSRSGERNSKTRLMQQEDDKNTFYLNAYIDDKEKYDTAVYYGVATI